MSLKFNEGASNTCTCNEHWSVSLDRPLEPVTAYMCITGKVGVLLSTCIYL